MGSHEAYLQSALSKYRHPDQTKREVLGIFQSFSDLRPNVMNYVFKDGQKKELLCLEGTIPATYKGKTYNIPICIYLMDTHPCSPPIIYVKPTPTMQINQGRHVDAAGRVYLPYLHEWKHPSSDLLGLIQILVIVFGEEPPVFYNQQTAPAGQRITGGLVEDKTTMGSHEAYLQSALSKYRHPDQTKQEVLGILQGYSDLRPIVMNCAFHIGQQTELLCLDGTIPVTYKGKTYNIPTCIYLMDTHPYDAPIVYVKPTPIMQIKPGRPVDAAGRVYLPCLHEWKYPSSDLLDLIQILAIVFGDEPPVFSKQQTTPATTSQPPHPVTQQPSGSMTPCSTTVIQSAFSSDGNVLCDEWIRLSLLSAEEDKIKRRLQEALAQAQVEMDLLKETQEDIQRERQNLDMLQKLVKEQYQNPDQTKREVLDILQGYGDLRPTAINCVLGNGQQKKLLCIEGGIPVTYNGKTYNIPICIYLMDTHPYDAPIVYVKPTPTMQIKQGRYVNAAGQVSLPFHLEWEHKSHESHAYSKPSDLLGLVQSLVVIFGEDLPVFSKQQTAQATTSHPPYPLTQQSAGSMALYSTPG